MGVKILLITYINDLCNHRHLYRHEHIAIQYLRLVMTEEFLYYGTLYIKKLSVEKSQKDFYQKATAIKDFDSVNYKCESPSKFPVYHTK